MITGQKSADIVIKVPVTDVWEHAYRGLELAKLGNKLLKDLATTYLLQGDGGVGTEFKLVFPPGTLGAGYQLERYVMMDDETRVKESEVYEGGMKALGFNLYNLRMEIIEVDDETSIIRSIIKYEVDVSKADIVKYVKD